MIVRPLWVRTILAAVALSGCGKTEAPAPTAPTTPGGVTPVVPVTPTGPVGPLVVGQVYTDPQGYVEFIPGDAPIVIIAPHGGTSTPTALPDRSCAGCVTTMDLNTQELARAIADAVQQRLRVRPHLIINRLHRRKFDANRDLAEATGGTAALTPTWSWFHAAIDSSKARVTGKFTRGLVIDLHGHGHAVQRLELGYLLTDSELRQTDGALSASNTMARTSIRTLAGDTRSLADRGIPMLRGANSFGTLLATAGFPAVPSAQDPAPKTNEEYFDGGYNTQRHGSVNGGSLDAVQIECNFTGVRDTESSRAAFASAVAVALGRYFEVHYGWKP